MSDLLAINLKLFRKKKGLSQADLAKACGVSVMSIRRYETIGNDNREPQADVLKAIARILDVKTTDLLSEGDEINIVEPKTDELREAVAALRYSLNDDGLAKTRDYMRDLMGNPKYKIGK